MDNEKEIVWTDDMGFMPPMVKTEGRIICRHECQLTEYKAEIERLRKENLSQRYDIMLLNSRLQTEHEIIRISEEGE